VIEIGVDIGGTFTDVVLLRDGKIAHFTKVPTTSSDPITGVRDGVDRVLAAIKIEASQVDRFVHGSTVAINALIQKKGAVTGLLATQGFEDTLEIGRHKRSNMYELFLKPETPAFLAPRRRRRGIPERVAADGSVVTPLDEDAVCRAVAELVSQGATALAVSYLFSFRNPRHEQRTREVIRKIHPDLHVSLSSEVDPAFREYERTVITTLDAYLHGAVGDYIARLRAELKRMGFSATLQVMQSRGGITNADSIMARPLALLLSGLAAGVIGSRHVAAAARQHDVISLDMGGTSCDIALIRSGAPILTNQTRVAHYPIRMQMVDVNTIGAGGGSIAWVDGAGGLRVGPHSAGADPGPACYRRGGQEATVTDASLVLGYLNPDAFAGGIRPDLDLAKAAIMRVADRIGMSLVATAAGIHRIVNARMNDEVRRVSVQRGYDPREFSLLPLGGAGPVHGSAIALDLGMASVIIPDTAGVLSAFGLLVANIEHDQMQTFGERADRADPADIEDIFRKLIALGQSKMSADGIAPDRVEIRRQADMRYAGQSYELTIALASDAADPVNDAVDRFHARHKNLYGHSNPGAPVELVNLRTVHVHRADLQAARDPGPIADPALSASDPSPIAHREAYFEEPGAYVRTPIYERRSMAAGVTIKGPAIIEQPDTTVVIHPSQRASMRADRSLLIEVSHVQ
jgi:N-methylhydantoinase A